MQAYYFFQRAQSTFSMKMRYRDQISCFVLIWSNLWKRSKDMPYCLLHADFPQTHTSHFSACNPLGTCSYILYTLFFWNTGHLVEKKSPGTKSFCGSQAY